MNERTLTVLERHVSRMVSGALVHGANRCGLGWMLFESGVPDEELRAFDRTYLGCRDYYTALWREYGERFCENYGVCNLRALRQLARAVDERGCAGARELAAAEAS
jgi:hypothetical protein